MSPYGTALSYIPEVVWSEGAFDIISQGSGVAGSGGGVSVFTGRPSWQFGYNISPTADPTGPTFTASGAIPATQLHRLVPDISGIAAGGHDGTIFCSEGVCKINSDGTIGGIGVVGGTSVATPTMAGMQALIDQANGGRQGNANYYYYRLAALETNQAACAANVPTGATPTLPPTASCYFHDVVTGDNYSPRTATGKYNVATGTYSGVFGTDYIGFKATPGFDEATGLGSPNVANLAAAWSTISFNATTTTLTLDKTSIVHGATINATIKVKTNNSSSAAPTGDVSIIAVGQTTGIDGNFYTLSGGTATAVLTQLPGGTYNIYAHYAGDSVAGASNSAPISITVTKEPSIMFVTAYNITTAGAANASITYTYGTSIYVDTDVQGNSATGVTNNGVLNTGVPTGAITYAITSNGATLTPAVENLDNYGTTFLEIGQTFTNFLLYANYPAIAPGPYTIAATYPGDNSFGSSNGSTAITVVKATPTVTLTASTTSINSGGLAEFSVTASTSGGGLPPTGGTATLTDTTTSTVLGQTGPFVNGAATFATSAITTTGAHVITATYNGDVNYNTNTSASKTVTVITGAVPNIGVTNTSVVSPLQVLNTASLTATVSPAVTANTTVAFYDAGTKLLGTATIFTGGTSATLNIATLTAGTHNITASTIGTATVPSATSLPLPVTVLKNTPTVALTSQQTNTVDGSVNMNAVLTPTPASAGAANPAPTLIMSFYDGATLLGTAPIIRTANYGYYTAAFSAPVLGVGVHTLTAQYLGDANYAAATSNIQTVTIGKTPTATTVSTSTTAVGVGIAFPISATVTPIIKGTPAVGTYPAVGGTVNFQDGATVIGSAPVVNGFASGTAALTTLGSTHSITAVYQGDPNYLGSTSAALTTSITTVTPTVILTVNPSSLTIVQGQAGIVTVTSYVTGNYTGTATLSCTGLPANTSCVFGTPTFTYTGSNATQAAPLTTQLSIITMSPMANGTLAGFFWLPGLLMAGVLAWKRRQLSSRGRQLLVMAILFCGVASATGCANSALQTYGTPFGQSNVNVVATTTGSTPASASGTVGAALQVTVVH